MTSKLSILSFIQEHEKFAPRGKNPLNSIGWKIEGIFLILLKAGKTFHFSHTYNHIVRPIVMFLSARPCEIVSQGLLLMVAAPTLTSVILLLLPATLLPCSKLINARH